MNVQLLRIQDLESPLSRYRSPIAEDRAELAAAYERIEELEEALRRAVCGNNDIETANHVEDVLNPHQVFV